MKVFMVEYHIPYNGHMVLAVYLTHESASSELHRLLKNDYIECNRCVEDNKIYKDEFNNRLLITSYDVSN